MSHRPRGFLKDVMTLPAPRPLIVCGMGRSGTRMCANILNNSEDVELQGEIGGPAGTRLLAWLEALHSQRREEDPEAAYARARAAFRIGASGASVDRPDARWFGHKTPRHERHFRRYETLFSDPENRPVYVYCIRNPFDVWRSYQAMPWNKFETVTAFLPAWIRSVHLYEGMRGAAESRVHLFNLDRMLAAPDWMTYLGPELFEPLDISPQTFRQPVQSLRNTNSAERKAGKIPDPISEADRGAIAGHPEVRRIASEHFPTLDLGAASTPTMTLPSFQARHGLKRLRRAASRAWKGAQREWGRSRGG